MSLDQRSDEEEIGHLSDEISVATVYVKEHR